MRWFGGVALTLVCGLVFHAALIWAVWFAFMLALARMNIAAGTPNSGNEFIGYWMVAFVLTVSSAAPLCVWDATYPQLERRAWLVAIRRCVAVVGSLGAFYALDASEPFAANARHDHFIFAYASPAIAVLIGLIYADVSRTLLAFLRLIAANYRRGRAEARVDARHE